jgi:hypothetical protein
MMSIHGGEIGSLKSDLAKDYPIIGPKVPAFNMRYMALWVKILLTSTAMLSSFRVDLSLGN